MSGAGVKVAADAGKVIQDQVRGGQGVLWGRRRLILGVRPSAADKEKGGHDEPGPELQIRNPPFPRKWWPRRRLPRRASGITGSGTKRSIGWNDFPGNYSLPAAAPGGTIVSLMQRADAHLTHPRMGRIIQGMNGSLSPVRACIVALLLLAWSGSWIPAGGSCMKPARGHACSCSHRSGAATRGGDCCMRMSPDRPQAVNSAPTPRTSMDPACIAVMPAALSVPAPHDAIGAAATRPPAPPPERLLTTQLLL